ncbi:MAG: ribosome assembly RNA-binding protein YhbY [Calditrichia bacterium]
MLTGKEKRQLRAEGHHLSPEVHVGKEGISEGLIQNVLNTFNTKELVKIKVLEKCPLTAKEVAEQITSSIDCELVQVLGRTILLFKEMEDDEES